MALTKSQYASRRGLPISATEDRKPIKRVCSLCQRSLGGRRTHGFPLEDKRFPGDMKASRIMCTECKN